MNDTEAFPWTPDNGDGTYSNPVLHADYSDPDVIRHGEDFWMTASSFNCAPGLPILHSRDLVNWRLVNHAIRQVPHASYSRVRLGAGVWAPAIRFHAGKFWIFFPMPDEGIYATCADDPAGEWEEPWQVCEARGWIDPCPFWDDDGRAYLVHAYAYSRSGLKERIHLRPMSPDGRRLIGPEIELFHTPHHLYLEGPKVHKIDGWYYILCPGGGVQTGWQVVFRSKNLLGPYEEKIVLEQGSTNINGPHQGALVELADSSSWFLHFQDRGPFGRIVHLQPVTWQDGWPLMGHDQDGNGIGEPVRRWPKPATSAAVCRPETSDDFLGDTMALQWQWHANWDASWYSLAERPGWLRLRPGALQGQNVALYPRLLGQKFPARAFAVTTWLDASRMEPGSVAGLAVTSGAKSYYLGLRVSSLGYDLVLGAEDALECVQSGVPSAVQLWVHVDPDASFIFRYSSEQNGLRQVPGIFQAAEGGWIGAKIGLFHYSASDGSPGVADFDYFRFQSPTF